MIRGKEIFQHFILSYINQNLNFASTLLQLISFKDSSSQFLNWLASEFCMGYCQFLQLLLGVILHGVGTGAHPPYRGTQYIGIPRICYQNCYSKTQKYQFSYIPKQKLSKFVICLTYPINQTISEQLRPQLYLKMLLWTNLSPINIIVGKSQTQIFRNDPPIYLWTEYFPCKSSSSFCQRRPVFIVTFSC